MGCQETLVRVQTKPQDINYVLKIVETYSHLAFAVQLDPGQGIVGFHTTRDQEKTLLSVLASLPRKLQILE